MKNLLTPLAAMTCFVFVAGFAAHRRTKRLQDAQLQEGRRHRHVAQAAERAIEQSAPAPPASS